MADYSFPSTLKTLTENRATVQFSAIEGSNVTDSIELYCPPNISISDGANYGRVNLGVMGNAINSAINDPNFFKDDITKIGSMSSGSGQDGSLRSILGATGEYGAYLATLAANNESYQDQTNFVTKMVVNPHGHSLYQGVNIRTFAFEFTMIAESDEEATTIDTITKTFRKHLYPELAMGSSIAKFPPLWKIQFTFDGNENQKIAPIHKSFLTSLQTTYNNENSSFHDDGAPFSVSVSIGFMESKANNTATINTYGVVS